MPRRNPAYSELNDVFHNFTPPPTIVAFAVILQLPGVRRVVIPMDRLAPGYVYYCPMFVVDMLAER